MSREAMQECRTHSDCFANRGGVCTCLKDNDFSGRDCPFCRKEGGAFYGNQQV